MNREGFESLRKNNKNKKKNSLSRNLFDEILIIGCFALALFLLLSMTFPQSMGIAGTAVSGILSGLFGFGAYICPLLMIGWAVMALLKKDVYFERSKIVIINILFLAVLSLVHVLGYVEPVNYKSFFHYISYHFEQGSIYNGGLIGAILGNLLISLVDKIGSLIILIAVILILTIILTGKSVFALIKRFKSNGNKNRRPKQRPAQNRNDIHNHREPAGQNRPIMLFNESKAVAEEEPELYVPEPHEEYVEPQNAGTEIYIPTTEEQEINPQPQQKPGREFPVISSEDYVYPRIDLLRKNPQSVNTIPRSVILENSRKLEDTLRSFGVKATVVEVSQGPSVTRYELSPGQGVKVSKISGLADDLALSLAAQGIRIEAPVPGKSVVGIELPNREVTPVFLREVLEDDTFIEYPSKLSIGLGKDIAGNIVVADIAKMPHLLIAGATGSGKSVCINTIVASILFKASPNEVKLLMIDPKVVELSVYNGIPHLLIPVVTDPLKAAGALNWAVNQMTERYRLFAETSVRDLAGYNAYLKEINQENTLPQIVIIIDELSDLMMVASKDVEDSICRLAQMARAAGIHLIIATQRPSVDVITGLIKANIPSRLAFAVSSGIDSRTILDMVGAEKLLGKGDMLFYPVGMSKPLRVQGAYITDKEVENLVGFLKLGGNNGYEQELIEKITGS